MKRFKIRGEDLVKTAAVALIILAALGAFLSIYRFFSLIAASGIASDAAGEGVTTLEVIELLAGAAACVAELAGGIYGAACAGEWEKAGEIRRIGIVLIALQLISMLFGLLAGDLGTWSVLEDLTGVFLAVLYWYGAELILKG